MKVVRPVFLVGSGRSGSTALHHCLALHPDLAWLSNLLDHFPNQLRLHRLLLRLGRRGFTSNVIARWFRPSEGYRYWELIYPGFSRPFRDLGAGDVNPYIRGRIETGLESLICRKREYLLMKITGWPRLRFLQEVFPDARFVHLVRDGRAVVNSLLKVPFWLGWRGPENWRWGPLPPQYRDEFVESGESFEILAAIQWKRLLDSVDDVREEVGDALIDVRYEDLCDDPSGVIRRIVGHCGIPDLPSKVQDRQQCCFRSENKKWMVDLEPRQQELVEKSLETHLGRFGYL